MKRRAFIAALASLPFVGRLRGLVSKPAPQPSICLVHLLSDDGFIRSTVFDQFRPMVFDHSAQGQCWQESRPFFAKGRGTLQAVTTVMGNRYAQLLANGRPVNPGDVIEQGDILTVDFS